MNYFESDNSKFAMEFLGQKDGILFYEQRRPDDSPETELEAIKSSTCWKLTRPLRSIMHFIRK